MNFPNLQTPGPADVVQAIQRGKFAEALAMGRQALVARPRDPALLQLTAIAALQSGAMDEGVDLLRRAHSLQPQDPGIAFNLAKALGDSGKPDEGLRLATRREFSAIADFRRLAAELARAAGRPAEARSIYQGLLQANPADAELLNNLGSACMAMGDFPAAVAALEKACTAAPALVAAWLNLAKACGLAGESEGALEAADRAASLAPGRAETALELGRALKLAGRAEEALTVLLAGFEKHRQSAELATEIGLTFSALAEFDKAEQAYRQALKCDARHAQAYLNLGILLEQGNQLEDLDSLLQLAASQSVSGPELDFITALALRRKGETAAARELAARPDPEDAVNPGVRHHLVGQLADQLGDREQAWAAFSAMNGAASASPAGRIFDGTEYHQYIAALAQAVTPDWHASWPELRAGDRKPPVFLVGFPRSGTTLLDTMLMGHSDLHVLEEEPVLAGIHDAIGDLSRIPDLDQGEVDSLRAAYFAGVESLGPVPPMSTIVDKLPLNMLRAPLIARLFPDARYILALRHPCDAVLSCFMQNFKVNRAMASFWTIDHAARTYDLAFSFWERCRAVMPMEVHAIHYEDLIADKDREISRLADFLGLEGFESMLDNQRIASERGRVRTPSYAQITQGIYRGASGRWEGYRQQMEPALPILAPWVAFHGYAALDQN